MALPFREIYMYMHWFVSMYVCTCIYSCLNVWTCDTVNHAILLDELLHCGIRGIRGVAYSSFKNYLTNRHQFVTYKGAKSKLKVINYGGPQGSILGPLLFLIFTNDLVSVCKSTLPIMFADDTSPFASGTDIHAIELSNISTWLKVSRLSLNVKKIHFMKFTNKRYSIAKIAIINDNETIAETMKTKFLDVIIDPLHPLTHTDPLFMQFDIKKIAHIHSFLIGRLMHRVYHGTSELFQGSFLVNSDVHNYLTRQTDHYHLPLFHTDLGTSSLRYYGAVLWNNIILSEVTYECSACFANNQSIKLCLVKYRTHLSAGLFFWWDFDGNMYIHIYIYIYYDGNYCF